MLPTIRMLAEIEHKSTVCTHVLLQYCIDEQTPSGHSNELVYRFWNATHRVQASVFATAVARRYPTPTWAVLAIDEAARALTSGAMRLTSNNEMAFIAEMIREHDKTWLESQEKAKR